MNDKNVCTAQNKIKKLEICNSNHRNNNGFSLSQNDNIDLVYTTSNRLKEQILYDNLVAYSSKTSNYYISVNDLNTMKSTLINRINELEKERITIQSELLNLKTQNEKINSQKLASTSLCKTLDENYQQLKSNFEKYKCEITESIRQTLQQSTATIQKLKQENERLNELNINLTIKNEELEKERAEKNKQIEEIKILKQKYENHAKINKRIIERIIAVLNTRITKYIEENENLKKANDELDDEVTSYSKLLNINEESGKLELSITPMTNKSFSYSATSTPSNKRVYPSNNNGDEDDDDDNSFQIISPIRHYNENCRIINYDGVDIIIADIIDDIEKVMNEAKRGLSESISTDTISLDRSTSFSSTTPHDRLLAIHQSEIINCYSDKSDYMMKIEEENRKMKEEILKIYHQVELDNSFNSSVDISNIDDDDEEEKDEKEEKNYYNKTSFGFKVFSVVTLIDNNNYHHISPSKNNNSHNPIIQQIRRRQHLNDINQIKKNEEKSINEVVDPTICPVCSKKLIKKMICHLCKKNCCFDCCKNHVVIPGKSYKRFVCDTCNNNIIKK